MKKENKQLIKNFSEVIKFSFQKYDIEISEDFIFLTSFCIVNLLNDLFEIGKSDLINYKGVIK